MKSRRLPIIDKNSWISSRVKGSRVIHVGCTDWPMTEKRIHADELLHKHLCVSSSKCVGIDLDKEGIAKLRELMPKQEFHELNAEQLQDHPELTTNEWDFIVAGDVVEHMNNPGNFFESARRLLNGGGTLMVTVPHTFSAKRFFWMLFTGIEQVHPDHTAYFSESTLKQIGDRHGFVIEKMYGFQWKNPTFKNRISNLLSLPCLWLTRGRCVDELAVEFKLVD